jgi:hypothetical protein
MVLFEALSSLSLPWLTKPTQANKKDSSVANAHHSNRFTLLLTNYNRMKKTNFTQMPFFRRWLFYPLFLLVLGYQELAAQSLACNDLVQASIDNTPNSCQVTINTDMILEGTPVPGQNYEIVIKQGIAVIATGINQVTITNASLYFGSTLTATIKNLTTNNSCWGQLILEDKMPPVITCSDITVNCYDNLNNIPAPNAVDNCDLTPTVTLVGEVVNSNNLCVNGYATIIRTYKASDDWGNVSASCTQNIRVNRPTVIDFPEDIIWTCEQYAKFPDITKTNPLHPYIKDTDNNTPLVIDVNLNPDCDDNDLPGTDIETINSTNTQNQGLGSPGNGLDDADVLGLTGSGVVKNIQGQYCNYQSTHYDQTLTACGNTFKIIRTWTVLNWCTGSVVTTGVGGEDNIQVVKVVDKKAPLIERPPFTVSANFPGQHPQPCRSQGFLLAPTSLSDNCNTITVKIFTTVGEAIYTVGGNGANGGLIPPPGLPVGNHNVVYQATDACGNQTTLNVPVTVIDDLVPIAVCDEITDVNLGSDGKAVVFASTFDDGSWDNCCLDHFEVRRMTDNCNIAGNTDFKPTVTFCCADITTSPITVVFRALDCDGNANECMVQVNVNDKTAPTLTNCPNNQRITCDWYAQNLETQLANLQGNQAAQSQYLDQFFGKPTFFDNCSYTLNPTISINIDQCLEGTITRTWSAKDPSNNQTPPQACTQRIFVDHVSDWAVEFPGDVSVNCTSTPPDLGTPEIFYETCELVAISHDDQLFTIVPDACYKIVRTWTVINWCVVGAIVDQEVVESPESAFGFPLNNCDFNGDNECNSRTFRDSWRNSPQARPGAAQATNTTGPDTDPDSDPWDGYITYQQTIKVQDSVKPKFPVGCVVDTVKITGNSCLATFTLPKPVVDECNPDYVDITSNGPLGAGLGPFPNIPPGTYNVTYTASDKCNNSATCSTTVTVVDRKKPTPYCKNGLVVELMVIPDPMVTIWASDFNAGSYDNCPGTLKFSFSSNTSETSRTYNCSHVGQQQTVQIWVTDAAGNQDYCETFVWIQANMQQCPDTLTAAKIGGSISNEENKPVENVTVNLSGQSNGSVMTTNAGMYNFGNIPFGNDVTVSPVKDDDPLNGVTTFDLVIISKHILGVQSLNSPYKIIAADANKSKSVTTADLVELRKLILQINTAFSNNTSWRFIKKGYVFPDPANPWSEPIPEVVSINDIPTIVLDADFVAVKTGDVNGSAHASLAGESVDDRNTTGTYVLFAEEKIVEKGEIFTVTFDAPKQEVAGYQFTLNFDPGMLDLVELIPGVAKEENFGLTLLEKGAVTASWNGNANLGTSLFSLTFQAKSNGKLSDLLNINSRFTKAEAYDLNGGLLGVHLAFNGTAGTGFALFQNTPNPFKGQTAIGFNLPEAGRAKLIVTDVSGKVVFTTEGDFFAGYNEVTLTRKNLPSFGVLYYTLETATETATKKMVVIGD